ncbi:MAG TPA: tRNA lysidine(34) synthetase TilS [Candidatus Saccharibacteria bacterium]|mgnify:FL=1|nr:tRNA lysidine(34) synthetase TilS [Candidatus Saccharibacteria bacterium]HRQ07227.1 tRNA lysidine(34) synthetase TilS [Candidatus Saccharibacteria bacterium]
MDQQADRVMLESGRYIVAVSGGVDSVVLLDMLANPKPPTPISPFPFPNPHFPTPNPQITVAHFDHGIRSDSAEDAEFVQDLTSKYGLGFETRREELGEKASEDLARSRRYKFLRSVAKKHDAQIVTAHHADDVIETIAINLMRGTGWRGLAVLDSDIIRPLTNMTKSEILDYAKTNALKWHEDSTNASDAYLRNRIRRKTSKLSDDDKRQLLALWSTQKHLKKLIESELKVILDNEKLNSRYFFTHLDPLTEIECLRYVTNGQLTRPQLSRLAVAIKTAKAGTTFQAGSGVKVKFTSRNFTVELIK